MRLVSFLTLSGHCGAGVVTSIGIQPLVLTSEFPVGFSPMRQLLELSHGRPESFRPGVTSPPIPPEEVMLCPPVPDPSKIIAAPVNYRAHGAEMRVHHTIDTLGVFLKAPSSLVPCGGTVRLPYIDRRFDQEGELAVVIGRQLANASEHEAAQAIVGYTCLLDITMRGDEERSMRKSFDSFTPMGPSLVTPDEVGPLADLTLRCRVDDETRQRARVGDLIWPVPKLVSYTSRVMRLEPGDVISTGTPAGVGPIRHGQRIQVDIDRVGSLRVTVDSSTALPWPTPERRAAIVDPP